MLDRQLLPRSLPGVSLSISIGVTQAGLEQSTVCLAARLGEDEFVASVATLLFCLYTTYGTNYWVEILKEEYAGLVRLCERTKERCICHLLTRLNNC